MGLGKIKEGGGVTESVSSNGSWNYGGGRLMRAGKVEYKPKALLISLPQILKLLIVFLLAEPN